MESAGRKFNTQYASDSYTWNSIGRIIGRTIGGIIEQRRPDPNANRWRRVGQLIDRQVSPIIGIISSLSNAQVS